MNRITNRDTIIIHIIMSEIIQCLESIKLSEKTLLDKVKSLNEIKQKVISINNDLLDYACQIGDIETVEYFLENNISGYIIKSKLLESCIKNGNLKIVKYLLKDNNIDIASSIFSGCIKNGHLEVVIFMMENCGARLLRNYFKNHLLMLSIKYGHLEIVKLFINNKTTIDDESSGPMECAIENGKLEIIAFLIENDFYDDDLTYAIENGYLESVKILVKCGVDIYGYIRYILTKCIECSDNRMLPYFVSIYSTDILKKELKNKNLKDTILEYIIKQDLSKYDILINIYREMGIDIYDMVENEK